MLTDAELHALIAKWRELKAKHSSRDPGYYDGLERAADDLESLLHLQEPELAEPSLGLVEFQHPVTGEPRWRRATQEEWLEASGHLKRMVLRYIIPGTRQRMMLAVIVAAERSRT